jgi:hypothetical protein
MAGTNIAKASVRVSLGLATKHELELAAKSLDEIRKAVTVIADELSLEPENAHFLSVAIQAESLRTALCGLSLRAACERMEIVSALAKDIAGGAS